MGNILDVNPDHVNGEAVDIHITVRGSDWYWAVCAVMTCATLSFMGLAFMKPRKDRIFYYITSGITLVAAVSYFSMASNLGWTPIDVEFHRSNSKVHGNNRQIFYVRYIDWFITGPLILLDLLLTAGMPTPTILFVLLINEFMVVNGLVGALVTSIYKWGYFTFALAALGYIVYQLAWDSRRHANALGKDVGRAFLYCGSLIAFIWLLYPISWGLSEGGNVIPPDSEAVFYGVLDLLAKPVFGALFIWCHRNINPAQLGLNIKDYTGEDMAVNGAEKSATNGHTNGHVNGETNGVTNNTENTPENTV